MSGVSPAHVGGLPVEEALASLGPALLLATAALSARLRRLAQRSRTSTRRR